MLSVPCCMLRRSPEYKVSANKYSQTAIGSLKRRSVQSEEAASGRNAALSLSQSHVVRYGSRYSKKFAATWFGHGRDSGCSLTLSHCIRHTHAVASAQRCAVRQTHLPTKPTTRANVNSHTDCFERLTYGKIEVVVQRRECVVLSHPHPHALATPATVAEVAPSLLLLPPPSSVATESESVCVYYYLLQLSLIKSLVGFGATFTVDCNGNKVEFVTTYLRQHFYSVSFS